eukprot:TRINITY_DN23978_c0_g2_i1.p1 TRINITY_DN23978_c0_g2~~TRINITY_DN23978_c0_g2_i1.p1  ORF type:complete len:185 (+),score=10.46 TRINITY_DN23978_c0_g2_i1:40-555(+)
MALLLATRSSLQQHGRHLANEELLAKMTRRQRFKPRTIAGERTDGYGSTSWARCCWLGEVLGRVIGGNVMDGKPKGEVGFDSYYNSTKGGFGFGRHRERKGGVQGHRLPWEGSGPPTKKQKKKVAGETERCTMCVRVCVWFLILAVFFVLFYFVPKEGENSCRGQEPRAHT